MKIVGIFDDEQALVKALRDVKGKGIPVKEVYTPYPIHEVLELLGRKSYMTVAAWIYGFTGALSVLAFLYYTSVIDWPLNYGGKPFNSFPSFIVITVVLTIFIVTIMSLLTFSVRAWIYPGKIPEIVDTRASDDKFLLVMEERAGEEEQIRDLLRGLGASEVNDYQEQGNEKSE